MKDPAPAFRLTIKTPLGQHTHDNDDLVNIGAFTRELRGYWSEHEQPEFYTIESVRCRGKMRDRYLEVVLGFFSKGDFDAAFEALQKFPKLPRYSEDVKK